MGLMLFDVVWDGLEAMFLLAISRSQTLIRLAQKNIFCGFRVFR